MTERDRHVRHVRHVLGISGGKDSAALAIYMRDKAPDMEYFFTDTGAELPETLDFIERLEGVLGKAIIRLNAKRSFDHLLKLRNNFLPSPKTRWCTEELKIKPFEEFIGGDTAISYVAIRADEDRPGYLSTKENIRVVFPFKDAGIDIHGVHRILKDHAIGLPAYYEWRSRSGCYFCFFQQKGEWLRLRERHPDLFERAKEYEKVDVEAGTAYTWRRGQTLNELVEKAKRLGPGTAPCVQRARRQTWQEILGGDQDESDDEACLICSL